MNNQFVIVVLLVGAFAASIMLHEQEKKVAADEMATQEANRLAKIVAQERADEEAKKLKKIEKAKFKDAIEHDSDPKTDTYKVIMSGSESFDPDKGDQLKFSWVQKAGEDVKLSSNTASSVSFSAPSGEYTFALTATDDYGLSTTASKTVKIGPEPNKAPVVIIDVRKGK